MTPAIRRTVFLAPPALWILVTVLGVAGVFAGAKREEGHSVRLLAPGVGYVNNATPHLISLQPSPVPFCWLCGREREDAVLLLEASHRSGNWLYRVAAKDPDLTGYSPERVAQAMQLSGVLAYEVTTGEKILAAEGSTPEGKQKILEGRGLIADAAHAMTPAMVAQLPEVSITREGCQILQTSLLGFLALWLLGWGAWWAMNRRRARAVSGI